MCTQSYKRLYVDVNRFVVRSAVILGAAELNNRCILVWTQGPTAIQYQEEENKDIIMSTTVNVSKLILFNSFQWLKTSISNNYFFHPKV